MSARFVFVTALAIAGLLTAAVPLWLAVGDRWSSPYVEVNATWRIEGMCKNVQNGEPIKGAQVTATFREPIAFKHHWRNPPGLTTTNVVTETDDEGRFELRGDGGSAYVKAQAAGFSAPDPWEDWSYSARNGIDQVKTNITLNLKPN